MSSARGQENAFLCTFFSSPFYSSLSEVCEIHVICKPLGDKVEYEVLFTPVPPDTVSALRRLVRSKVNGLGLFLAFQGFTPLTQIGRDVSGDTVSLCIS